MTINAVVLPFSTRAFAHNSTLHRDAAGAHPMSAITGLDAALSDRYTKEEADAKLAAKTHNSLLSRNVSGAHAMSAITGLNDALGARYTKTETDDLLAGKQKTLTAGANINITAAGVISASGQFASTWGLIGGDIDDQSDLKNRLDSERAYAESVSAFAYQVDERVAAEEAERAYENEQVKKTMPNKNLFRNPWFLVNQRMADLWTGLGFHVDCWKGTGTSAGQHRYTNEQGSSHEMTVYAEASSSQGFAQPSGICTIPKGTFTVSANVTSSNGKFRITMGKSDGNVSYKEFNGETGIVTATFDNSEGLANEIRFVAMAGADNYVSIDKVKMEVGSVSTLANDVEPDYHDELMQCLPFFYRIKALPTEARVWEIGVAIATATTSLYSTIYMPVPMVKAPSVTPSTAGAISCRKGTGTNIDSTSIDRWGGDAINSLCSMRVNGTAFEAGSVYKLTLKTGEHIDFSAEP